MKTFYISDMGAIKAQMNLSCVYAQSQQSPHCSQTQRRSKDNTQIKIRTSSPGLHALLKNDLAQMQ